MVTIILGFIGFLVACALLMGAVFLARRTAERHSIKDRGKSSALDHLPGCDRLDGGCNCSCGPILARDMGHNF